MFDFLKKSEEKPKKKKQRLATIVEDEVIDLFPNEEDYADPR